MCIRDSSRVARFVGHNVITDNHIGDWGTQFGMILWGWQNILDAQALAANPIDELLRVYKDVNLMLSLIHILIMFYPHKYLILLRFSLFCHI